MHDQRESAGAIELDADGAPSNEDGSLLLIGAAEVADLLAGREADVLELVRAAYLALQRGETATPASSYLRFPDSRDNRIIAKPARLGAAADGLAGVKWVSSFPGNLSRGLPRCSALLILNSGATGRPRAVLEGALINFQRTAAAGALAATVLGRARARRTTGLVGCGNVNFEQMRYLLAACPGDRDFSILDFSPARSRAFLSRCQTAFPDVSIRIAADLEDILESCDLISFATTSAEPYVASLDRCAPGTLILHTSLRDIGVDAILASDNVVDDVSHVCSAGTSVHLAAQRRGNTHFIRATIGEVLAGAAPPKPRADAPTIFSPFGLAITDLAVGRFVMARAAAAGAGTLVRHFLS